MISENETEDLDELDLAVLHHLGYAVARAQLLELAMVKLLEAQRHDLDVPLSERWDEINGWLKNTAGQLATLLGLPPSIAADLQILVKSRNVIAHESWTGYIAAREKAQGDSASADWQEWLTEQASVLGRAYNGVMRLAQRTRDASPNRLHPAEAEHIWREHVPAPL